MRHFTQTRKVDQIIALEQKVSGSSKSGGVIIRLPLTSVQNLIVMNQQNVPSQAAVAKMFLKILCTETRSKHF